MNNFSKKYTTALIIIPMLEHITLNSFRKCKTGRKKKIALLIQINGVLSYFPPLPGNKVNSISEISKLIVGILKKFLFAIFSFSIFMILSSCV